MKSTSLSSLPIIIVVFIVTSNFSSASSGKYSTQHHTTTTTNNNNINNNRHHDNADDDYDSEDDDDSYSVDQDGLLNIQQYLQRSPASLQHHHQQPPQLHPTVIKVDRTLSTYLDSLENQAHSMMATTNRIKDIIEESCSLVSNKAAPANRRRYVTDDGDVSDDEDYEDEDGDGVSVNHTGIGNGVGNSVKRSRKTDVYGIAGRFGKRVGRDGGGGGGDGSRSEKV